MACVEKRAPSFSSFHQRPDELNNTFVRLKKWFYKKLKKSCRPSSTSFLAFVVCLLMIGLTMMSMPHALMRLLASRSVESSSVWLFRSQDGLFAVAAHTEILGAFYPTVDNFDASKSPFILPPGSDKSEKMYLRKKPERSSRVYTIGYYDPVNELEFLGKTNFRECEYDKCMMTEMPETADAVIFYEVKLKNFPTAQFVRKPGQIWILKTDEAPSRFSWFISLNRTGMRDQVNWTMTHKLNSDIPLVYDEIYERKSKSAAWFVSHCPVRSDRTLYVDRMMQRIDVDGFGACGTLTCGQGEKIPGVVGMRIEADKETCFPLLSSSYKYYLAFENSLCQEYVTEKLFKLFGDVDIVPVVRGGANYKSYFPPGTFVDAADFGSPESLADFLDDLGNDKERYIFYLRNKNRYRVVWDFPDWQCKLCQKLHVDHRPQRYENIHQWFTKDSCIDPKDFS